MGLGKSPVSTSSTMKPPANTAKGAFDGAPYRTDCFVSPCPVVIRKGLAIDRIMMHLADGFNTWDYRHGEYY